MSSINNVARILNQTKRLPSGTVIPNRLAKAAMNEQLGDANHAPTAEMNQLYQRWALGGAGLMITGNVMIDHKALVLPRDIVIEDEQQIPPLKEWANAGKTKDNHIWIQINHPGRQSPRELSPEPVAPSPIPLQLGDKDFAKPRALTEGEIEQLIQKYANTAIIVKKAGFTGVQIHAAHGYLINQFLSPLSNQRTDKWGGSLDKRMAFLLEIYRTIRKGVGKDYPIGVKLNSADFQRGGFSAQESIKVAQKLEEEGIDLIEISGGTYEKLTMMGEQDIPQKESTKEREAYFLEYSRQVRRSIGTPIMLTGGFRSGKAMAQAIEEGSVDIIGLARPLVIAPNLPMELLSHRSSNSNLQPLIKNKDGTEQNGMTEILWYTQEIHRLSAKIN